MADFTFEIQADGASVLELKLGQYLPGSDASSAAAFVSASQAAASATTATTKAAAAAASAAEAAASAAGNPGSAINAQLIAWTNGEAFTLISAVRDTNGAITTASVQWPDGTPGVATTDIASTAFPGKVDAFHVTYVGETTKTVTQSAVTRNANGAIIVQPQPTVA